MVSAERERAAGEARIACEVAEALRSAVGAWADEGAGVGDRGAKTVYGSTGENVGCTD